MPEESNKNSAGLMVSGRYNSQSRLIELVHVRWKAFWERRGIKPPSVSKNTLGAFELPKVKVGVLQKKSRK